MRTCLILICSLALVSVARGAEEEQTNAPPKKKQAPAAQASQHAVTPGGRPVNAGPGFHQTIQSGRVATLGGRPADVGPRFQQTNRTRSVARPQPRTNTAMNNQQNRAGKFQQPATTTTTARGQTHATVTNNWKGSSFSGQQYTAFRNYSTQWHDSDWWRRHHDRIVFVFVFEQPFAFFFDSGFWFPAWGYYPGGYYPYDGPIYGYNDLPPDQVIVNVQTALQAQGYYQGEVDGVLGPLTRAAIADYQRDHGLAITAAIDEPTVASLGLV